MVVDLYLEGGGDFHAIGIAALAIVLGGMKGEVKGGGGGHCIAFLIGSQHHLWPFLFSAKPRPVVVFGVFVGLFRVHRRSAGMIFFWWGSFWPNGAISRPF
jgi:hypothetical protein